jgi:hypothetical protein
MLTPTLLIMALALQDPLLMDTTTDIPPLDAAAALPFEGQTVFEEDFAPPEPDPEFTVRRGTRYTSTPSGPGRVRITLTGSARITVSLLGRSWTGTLGPGSSVEGRDRNGNGIPDQLDAREVDIGPL